MATRDVVDAIMADPERAPHVFAIDLREWWYQDGPQAAVSGARFEPRGGADIAFRYQKGAETTPYSIYYQTSEYRRLHPTVALINNVGVDNGKA